MQRDPRPGLPDRRLHPRPRRASARPTRPAAASSRCAPRPSIETQRRGEQQSIVVTEIPYQVNKARLIEKIAELVRDKQLEGISDLRDESDRDGIRIVIEVKRDEVPEVILNSALQADPDADRPSASSCWRSSTTSRKVLTLKELLAALPRSPQDGDHPPHPLRPAQGRRARPHPGRPAQGARSPRRGDHDHPREPDAARGARAPDGQLRASRDVQAQAILDMRLQRLTGLEREKIVEEYQELMALIERLRAILGSDKLVLEEITPRARRAQGALRRQAAHRDHPRDAARSRSRT